MSVASQSALDDFWSAPCKILLKNQQLVVIDSQETITCGFEKLVKHSISSAPVFDEKRNDYVGMFDYRDLLEYFLLVFHKKKFNAESKDEEICIAQIVKDANEGKDVSMQFASDLSRKNPFISVSENDSIKEVVRHMLVPKHVHRVNVTNNSKKVIGIISQTDILNYISKNIHLFAKSLIKTVCSRIIIDC